MRVGSISGYRLSSLEEFSLVPIHPPLVTFSGPLKSNRMDPRMSFKQPADETLTEAWERYHGFMTDLTTVGMEDWEFNQGILLWVVTRS
jgi:hypothetical protein